MLCNKSTLFDTCVLYHREQYKICLPGILRKNKVLILKPIRYEFSLFFFYFQVTLYNPLGFLEYYIQRGIRSPAFSEARLTSLKWLLSTYRAQRLLELFRIQSPARLKKKSLIIHGIFLKDQYLTWIIWEVLSLRQ